MRYEKESEYEDIINMPRHVSKTHPQMPLSDRAAQFSPFAALTGHGAAIRETARLTEDFLELDEDRKRRLDELLWLIRENQVRQPEIEVTYFQPDSKKSGGAYMTVRGRVKKIDDYYHRIVFADGAVIPMETIFSIEFQDCRISGKEHSRPVFP